MKFRKAWIGTALAAALMLGAALPASAVEVLSVGGRNIWNEAGARLVGWGTTYVSLRTVAGPVLDYGISASAVYGVILWLLQMTE